MQVQIIINELGEIFFFYIFEAAENGKVWNMCNTHTEAACRDYCQEHQCCRGNENRGELTQWCRNGQCIRQFGGYVSHSASDRL